MKEKRDRLYKLAFGADLPGESLPGQTVTELIGDRRLLIENHRGILAYSCEKIIVKVVHGQICVSGSGLSIACMSRQQLVITGKLTCISVLKER